MLAIEPIPAFNDNYIWCLHNGAAAFVVDPGAAKPVLEFIAARHLTLAGILITHHHMDHTGGVAELLQATGIDLVYGPHNPQIAHISRALTEHDVIEVLGLRFAVLNVPGHTLDHIAYYCASHRPPILFCGDTLFAAGCGRLFEGTPLQMFTSLQKLAQLPPGTAVYCTHEYTLANLRFARAAEPDNPAVLRRFEDVTELRARDAITLPSSIDTELATNPFLRCHTPAIQAMAHSRDVNARDPVDIFATLRRWKDQF
jgi:hydroxyacylglutathione hydrolase